MTVIGLDIVMFCLCCDGHIIHHVCTVGSFVLLFEHRPRDIADDVEFCC